MPKRKRTYPRMVARIFSIPWGQANGLTAVEASGLLRRHIERLGQFPGESYRLKTEAARLKARETTFEDLPDAQQAYTLARHVGAAVVPDQYRHLRYVVASFLCWELAGLEENPWEPLIQLVAHGGIPKDLSMEGASVQNGEDNWRLSFTEAASALSV